MQAKEDVFLRSARTETGRFIGTEDLLKELAVRQADPRYKVEAVSWDRLEGWKFDQATGNLVHGSGRFFSIEGIRVSTNFGAVPCWTQPIIVQSEIGILGFLAKRFEGVLHLLVQAKMEPGNLNMVQLSPTVQATRSNYTQAHRGLKTKYLEYFLDHSRARVLVDQLQSEQGARFLRKRNRNMVVETSEEVPVHEGFHWVTLGQIHALIRQDNVVNMDARSVLSTIPLAGPGQQAGGAVEAGSRASPAVLGKGVAAGGALRTHDEIISWFTELKTRYELEVERIPLKDVGDWARDDRRIFRKDGKYFSVIGVSVEAGDREVPRWTQPMVQPQHEGVIGFLTKRIDGTRHFLVHAKLEPGNLDVLELAPTVQCITGSYKAAKPEDLPAFLHDILDAPPDRVRYAAFQSEEGGRFYREQNRNMVVEAGEDFPAAVPPDFAWMTPAQMNEFIKYNNYFNVEARSLIAAVGLPEEE
ncbi:MAG: NDP-hexose 2,3-dehydratase family protein [Elusimicrobia bacterium]|nr:NDP-hexose 2,3-dehydratase family protein [Elusimicrobiota bacterium]